MNYRFGSLSIHVPADLDRLPAHLGEVRFNFDGKIAHALVVKHSVFPGNRLVSAGLYERNPTIYKDEEAVGLISITYYPPSTRTSASVTKLR